MAKGRGNKSGGTRNSNRNNGKASKKNPKQPNIGSTGRSRGGYNLKKRSDKANSWNAVDKRRKRKARRRAAGLALAHGLRSGQLSKVKANADS